MAETLARTHAGSAESYSAISMAAVITRTKGWSKISFAFRNRLRYMFNRMVKYSSRTLNRTFAALADPTRRRILAHLAHGERCVTDLARPHAMSLPAVSTHLRVLEKAGLIRRRRYGRIHQLNLEAVPMKQAFRWIEEYRKFWEGSLDRLAEYLEKTHKRTGKKGKN
jgi:DNA-binding transcriptional ArsR family regulator